MVAQLDTQYLRHRPAKAWSRLLAYTMFEGRPLTTRGRIINPGVFAFQRAVMHLPEPTAKLRPIFIYGVGRSGTTALGRVLSIHKDVGYLNEPKAIWHSAIGNDDLIGSYSTSPGSYVKTGADFRSDTASRLSKLYNAYARLSGSKRIVDKYPEQIFRDGLICRIFPDAYKIILVRNGADTCRSVEKWSQDHGLSSMHCRQDWWGLNRRKWHLLLAEVLSNDPAFTPCMPSICGFTRQVDMAAVEWIATMREAMRLIGRHPANTILVRYEKLVADPVREMARISTICRLRHDPVMLDYARETLCQQAAHREPSLHPAIRPLFDDTMKRLNYTTRPSDAHLANIA